MNEYDRNRLIQLFAQHPVDHVEANDGQLLKDTFGPARYDALQADPAYQHTYTLVKEYKKELEHIARTTAAPRKQIHALLYYLKQIKHDQSKESLDVLSRLIRQSLYGAWAADEQAYYDQRHNIIIEWVDFFISYTNRDAGSTNHDFQDLYESVYFASPPPAVRNTTNLVAPIIVKYLNEDGLEGFADWNDIKSGDEIGESVRTYCRKAYAFVQLVERVCFTKPNGSIRNWCFEEYNTFKQAHLTGDLGPGNYNTRFHFLIVGDNLNQILPAQPPPSYNPWHQHMGQVHHGFLKQRPHGGAPMSISKYELIDALHEIACKVVEVKEQVLDELLSDY